MSREIDADIAGMDGEDMADEIMRLRVEVAALREQLERQQVEREELKRTYDKSLEAASINFNDADAKVHELTKRVSELEAKLEMADLRAINISAGILPTTEAIKRGSARSAAGDAAISPANHDAEIVALEKGKEK